MSADWMEWLGAILAESSVRAAVLGVTVALLLALGRVRSPRVTHAAWTSVLCAMLLMPVLPRWVPDIEVPVPDLPFASGKGALPIGPEATTPPRGVGRSEALPRGERSVDGPIDVGGAPARPRSSRAGALFAVYAIGLAILTWRVVAGLRGMSRVRRAARTIEGEARFLESSAVTAPLTVGLVWPVVVLPPAWRDWPDGKLNAVLAHELAHIAGRDPLCRFVASLNVCVFWFHPLAWWLERTLSSTAEDACDDAAVRTVGEPRLYAEVLLDIARAVRLGGGRLARHGLSAGGNGQLGRRIDRVLRGESGRDLPRSRKLLMAVGCAVAILLAGAWRYQREPLRENSSVAVREAQRKAEIEFHEAARSMTPAQLAEVEATWRENAEDFKALKKILIHYGHDFSGQRPSDEAAIVESRRRYILWLIEHHPEHELAGSWAARIFRTPLDPLHDPQGYEEAKQLWLMHADRADIGSAALSHGAWFFEANDKALAERLLLKGQAIDPKPEWSARLGRLYALAILGSNASMPLNVLRSVSVEESRSVFARQARRKLDESTDARLLAEAGRYLVQARQFFTRNRATLAFHPTELGEVYARRALGLDPDSVHARNVLASLDERHRQDRLRAPLLDTSGRQLPRGQWPAIIATLPDRHRFELLPELADQEYMWAEHLDFTTKDAAGVVAAWARSKAYATQALALASMFTDHPDYGSIIHRTHVALGAHALREGDRETAVFHLLEAARAPGTREVRRAVSLEPRLVHYLLNEGERESIVEFLETSARNRPDERARLLKDAAALRRGEMPEIYQLRLARAH
jgi:hypothetical protein